MNNIAEVISVNITAFDVLFTKNYSSRYLFVGERTGGIALGMVSETRAIFDDVAGPDLRMPCRRFLRLRVPLELLEEPLLLLDELDC